MKTIRFGLIGYGAWGSHHAQAITQTPGAQLVAVAARSERTRELARTAHPGTTLFADYRELLKRSDLDVVSVVLPSHLHYEVAKAVLECGRHLLLEKPMALTVEHCADLNRLAKERSLLLAIGHEFRFSALWGKLKQMIQAGDIGVPLYALIELWRRPYRLGSDGWRYDSNRVGNWILEEPIHFFDLARWYLAQHGEPLSVYAQANSINSDRPHLHDNFSAILNFPGGAYVVISQTLAAYEHHQVVKLTGTEGALWASWSGALDRTLQPTFSLKHQRKGEIVDVPIEQKPGEVFELQTQVRRMVEAVREGASLAATGLDGQRSVAMCLAAQESVASGKPVSF